MPFPTSEDLSDRRNKPASLASPAPAGGFLATAPPGNVYSVAVHSEDIREKKNNSCLHVLQHLYFKENFELIFLMCCIYSRYDTCWILPIWKSALVWVCSFMYSLKSYLWIISFVPYQRKCRNIKGHSTLRQREDQHIKLIAFLFLFFYFMKFFFPIGASTANTQERAPWHNHKVLKRTHEVEWRKVC